MIDAISRIHIEPTNICTLKCAGCSRTRFIEQWPQHWKNHSLDIDTVLEFLDIDLCDKKILLCGNYGDPIYHPDFIEFVHRLKQRGATLSIITNGSHRTQEWWEQLVGNLTNQDRIHFSVDGTPENFTQYRVNADWATIKTGMQVVAQSSCQSVWKYIPFSFNQHDIDRVEKLSQEIGIDQFQLYPSDRFDEKTQWLVPDSNLLGARYRSQTDWKSGDSQTTVKPKCQDGAEHFITADGHYSSCCYLADHRFYYKTPFGKNKKQYDIQKHTLTQLLQQPPTVEFYQTLDQQPGCQYNCPAL